MPRNIFRSSADFANRQMVNDLKDCMAIFSTNKVSHTCHFRRLLYFCWFKNNDPSWLKLGLEMSKSVFAFS